MDEKNDVFIFKTEKDKKFLTYLIEHFGECDLSQLSKEDIDSYNNIRNTVGLKKDDRWDS